MLDIKEEDFMKKSIAMLLAVAMTVSLAGCGGGQAETAGSAAEQTTAVEAAAGDTAESAETEEAAAGRKSPLYFNGKIC